MENFILALWIVHLPQVNKNAAIKALESIGVVALAWRKTQIVKVCTLGFTIANVRASFAKRVNAFAAIAEQDAKVTESKITGVVA